MIGIFDSGLGGLTVLKELITKLPQYDYIYLGDNARSPYGNKTQTEIFNYTKQAIDFLFNHNCELIIVACNTASTSALRKIQTEVLPSSYPDKKVLGVLVPVVEELIHDSKNNSNDLRVGVIATEATILSGKYEKEIEKQNPNIKVLSHPTPLLVKIVEAGKENELETINILKNYLQPFKDQKINYLILGCTHYPFLQKQIEEILDKKIKIINTPEAVAKKLKEYLERHQNITKRLSTNSQRYFFTTGDKEKFKKMGEKFLNNKIFNLEKIEL